MEKTFEFIPGSIKKAAAGVTSADLWKWPVDRIKVVDGFNVRERNKEYRDRVEAIKASILENGYMADKPIAGYVIEEDGQNTLIITDGHTRFEAVQTAIAAGAEIAEVPVVTKPRGTSMEDLTVALYTSNTGERLTPYETAKVCKRLIGYGMDEATIAQRLALTRTYVSSLLDLLAAPKAVRDMVSDGKVSASEALKTVKAHGKEAAKVLAKAAKSATKERITAKDITKATDSLPPFAQKALAWMVKNDGLVEFSDPDEFALKMLADVCKVDQQTLHTHYERMYNESEEAEDANS